MLILLSLLACAPDSPTAEERADAAYDGCVTMYTAWCDCTPDVCEGYTPEFMCEGYANMACDP